ncbi:membrane protein [Alkalibacterium sp. AK22]|uniref:DUF368 domain-containing protein n=1 Tax=Alkalibacterium sp. AK22 TaxID=1229520 RepID=UPI000447954E|nr:DUF368 domain-containing protein [Alkalibacterium sp. AK22]EXJ23097.1 membrane protein [Alkalibacterium sp. AK22]
MNYFWMAVKGIFIGISNIIPGVSGGTMAVSFGIYDDVIHAFTHIRKEPKASLKILIPLIVGALAGVAGFSIVIEWLLDSYPLYTTFAFVGLILGGLPILNKAFTKSLKAENKTIGPVHIGLALVFFLIVAWMGVAEVAGGGVQTVSLGAGPLMALFLVGVIAAAAMVIPGVSGSLLMLIIGYYHAVIYTINGFTESLRTFDMDALIPFTILLIAYAAGMVVGIILISKLIDYFFKTQPGYTYAGILGLVMASPIAVISNTQALAHTQLTGAGIIRLLIALLLAVGCYAMTYGLGRTKDSTEAIPQESKPISNQ